MDFNVSELRKQGRPLWMTNAGVENLADLLGGGGDLYTDRLAPDWDRNMGAEDLTDVLEMTPREIEELLVGNEVDDGCYS